MFFFFVFLQTLFILELYRAFITVKFLFSIFIVLSFQVVLIHGFCIWMLLQCNKFVPYKFKLFSLESCFSVKSSNFHILSGVFFLSCFNFFLYVILIFFFFITFPFFAEGFDQLKRVFQFKKGKCKREKMFPAIKPFFIVEWKLKSPCIGLGVEKLGKMLDITYPIRKLPLQKEMWFLQYFVTYREFFFAQKCVL